MFKCTDHLKLFENKAICSIVASGKHLDMHQYPMSIIIFILVGNKLSCKEIDYAASLLRVVPSTKEIPTP